MEGEATRAEKVEMMAAAISDASRKYGTHPGPRFVRALAEAALSSLERMEKQP